MHAKLAVAFLFVSACATDGAIDDARNLEQGPGGDAASLDGSASDATLGDAAWLSDSSADATAADAPRDGASADARSEAAGGDAAGGDAARGDAAGGDAAGGDAAGGDAQADATPPDAGADAAEDLDAGGDAGSPIGELCTTDAQCGAAPCMLVRNGAHAATQCVQICGPFRPPCPVDTVCYDDGTNRVCVLSCADGGAVCRPGQECLPTFPTQMGCLPAN